MDHIYGAGLGGLRKSIIGNAARHGCPQKLRLMSHVCGGLLPNLDASHAQPLPWVTKQVSLKQLNNFFTAFVT